MKRKYRDLEKKEYTQMVHFTSLESKSEDFNVELKKRNEIILKQNKVIIRNTRTGYLTRFIIIGQLLLMAYIYLINDIDSIDSIFNVI